MTFLESLTLVLFLLSFGQFGRAFQFQHEYKFQVKERIEAVPAQYEYADAAADGHVIDFMIGLPQPGQEDLEAYLLKSSDPDHERYGQHLSLEQVQALTQPSAESMHLVLEWLLENNITDVDHTMPGFLAFSLDVARANALLNTTYNVYQHKTSDAPIVRTTEFSLPQHLHKHIDIVQPTTSFSQFREQASTLTVAQTVPNRKTSANACPKGGCSSSVKKHCNLYSITPACIRALYNMHYTPKLPNKQNLGITGYLNENANIQDLKKFAKFYDSGANLNFSIVNVNGAKNSQKLSEAGIEADLDVQLATSLSYPIHNTFYATKGKPPFKININTPSNSNEPYLTYLSYLAKLKKVPSVISTSYGDDEQTVPKSYAIKVCKMYSQLTARGVSILHSSGDGGVTGAGLDGDCVSSTTNKKRFLATFPATCPWVTSVGSTSHDSKLGLARQIAGPWSGGGFSEYFDAPSWQTAQIAKYMTKSKIGTSLKGLFNPSGRGFPDVAVFGNNFGTVSGGESMTNFGTSCSTPVFAAMVALLNDKRLAAGKSTLGFLNPWLYKKAASAFTPITKGSNPGCGPFEGCVPSCKVGKSWTHGFPAKSTWSPVTGLGVPDFAKLLKLA